MIIQMSYCCQLNCMRHCMRHYWSTPLSYRASTTVTLFFLPRRRRSWTSCSTLKCCSTSGHWDLEIWAWSADAQWPALCKWFSALEVLYNHALQIDYFIAVVLNNTALTTSTQSNPGHLVPCGSEHEGTISSSQLLSTNLTNAILLFVLFFVMSSVWSYYVCVLF